MHLHFSDSNDEYESSRFVIFGVPYDGTSSYRHGAKFAPNEIRKASYNLESYLPEHGIDMRDLGIHDMGDIGTLDEFGSVEDVINVVHFTISKIMDDKKFPIMLGGEHSITVGAAKYLRARKDVGIVFIDAHADFRDEYLGNKYSHACVARRSYELLNGGVISLGVRSVSQEEYEHAKKIGYRWLTSYQILDMGWKEAIKMAMEILNRDKIYLSIDIDGIDPAYAPGTGTPEYFGLSPMDVKGIINFLGDKIIGGDIVEVNPEYDNGNTSILAARLVQEIISVVSK